MTTFIPCKICGGKGHGLVSNQQHICAHCARETKAFFDPDSNEWCLQGFVDISPKADGGVLKKTIKEADPTGEHPVEGCPTFVQYVGRLTDGSIFGTTREEIDGKLVGGTDDPFEFRLGHEKVIQGWDIGVATMNKGEIARFIISPEYGYGKEGFAPKVEPGAILDYEIEVVDFGTPLPKFPSKAELDASKAKRAAEERKLLEENPPPSIADRIASSMKEKESGNKLVAVGKFKQAKDKYDSGFVHIFISKEEWEHLLTDDDKTEINAMKLPLYLNRALCKIKTEQYDEALWDCDQAILIDEKSIKGHFRRGLVYIEKLRTELEKEKMGDFWVVEKAQKFADEAHASLLKALEYAGTSDKQIIRAQVDLGRQKGLLNKYIKEYKQAEQRLYKEKIMVRMDAQNRRAAQNEEKKQLHDQFADMPPLE